ncbi:hypothetical protein MNBD_ALPHA01-848 [hydrothermal vent metagenome]|uniref:Uncharacterized protein n=1 Tax=hydrothermal vent metagenome TaxID=652676 RepID=A0A3B0SD59_9ZZZZ
MTRNILKTVIIVSMMALPAAAFAGPGQQNSHDHMKNGMKAQKSHDMTSMMDNMDEMHGNMKQIMEKMQNSPQKSDMMKLHQNMTLTMKKMKMMHKNMDHKMPEAGAKKMDHKKMDHKNMKHENLAPASVKKDHNHDH